MRQNSQSRKNDVSPNHRALGGIPGVGKGKEPGGNGTEFRGRSNSEVRDGWGHGGGSGKPAEKGSPQGEIVIEKWVKGSL